MSEERFDAGAPGRAAEDERAVDRRPVREPTAQERAVRKPAVEEAADKQAVKKRAVKKRAVKKQAVKKQAVKKQAVKKQAVKKQAVEKRAVKKRAVKKRAVAKQPVKKQAVKKQAVKKQAVKKQAAAKAPAGRAGPAGAAAGPAAPGGTSAPARPAKRPVKRPAKRPAGRPRPGGAHGTPAATAAAARAAKAAAKRPAPPPSLADRLLEPVDTSGRKALVGLLWLASLAAALWLGVLWLGVLFGVVGAVAGLHGARAWRRRGWPVSRLVAGLTPLLAGIGAGIGNGAAGAVLLAGVAATIVASVVHARRVRILDTAGSTLRSWLPAAVTAVSVVAVYRVSLQAAVGMFVLCLAYDVGAYVWGAGVHRPLASRVTGIVTVLVATFALGVVHMVLELRPFESSVAVWIFGGLAAACCPLGQIVVSASLPTARDTAPALRRLDSFVVTAPAWAMALWSSLG